MISIQHVVCPVDFSDESRRALEYAAVLARWYEARLTVLHVFANLPVIDPVPLYRGQPLALRDVDVEHLSVALQEFVATVQCEVPVSLEVAEASEAHSGILAQLKALRPDLLVMGTHGRTGFQRFVLGSVTERVLRTTTCPVLAVPPHARQVAQTGVFKHIVAAVDFSAPSVKALRCAFDLAEEADAEITLLHVIELPPELREAAVTPELDVNKLRIAAEADALQRLRELVPAQARTYCTVHTMAAEGRAHREIIREAGERDADLIVMGIRGHGAVNRLVFGSNTHNVLTAAACPVLAVP